MRSAITAVLCLLCAAPAHAGDLAPNGAPAPTMKTLLEVEPRRPVNQTTAPGDADSVFRITVPGSYYLTGSFFVTAGKRGVEIATSDVTLDLNGYAIRPFGAGSLEGVQGASGARNIVVRNGSILGMDSHGVDLRLVEGGAVSDLVVQNCDGDGVRSGFAFVITGCSADGNGGVGFRGANTSVIRDCTARSNGADGFNGIFTADNCLADGNAGFGFLGSGAYANCLANLNERSGFAFNGPTVVNNCRSGYNFEHGFSISTSKAVRIANATADSNSFSGYSSVQTGARVDVHASTANENFNDGFLLLGEARLTDCASTENLGRGLVIERGVAERCHIEGNGDEGVEVIGAGPGAVLRGSVIASNSGHGVLLLGDSAHIEGNIVTGHTGASGGAGIRVDASSFDNRIDGNRCTDNLVGLQILGTGNTALRNILASNTNAPIGSVGGNVIAPLQNTATATSPFANLLD